MKKYVTPGLLLILVGLYFLLEALPGISLPNGTLLVLLGLALLVSRIITGKYGLSIAGFLILCVGASRMMVDLLKPLTGMAAFVTPLSLALAFFLIHIFENRHTGNWPLIPALVLLCVGTGVFLVLNPEVNALLAPYYGIIFPVILILVGIALLVRGARSGRQPRRPAQGAPRSGADPSDPSTWAQPPVGSTQRPAPAPKAAPVPEAAPVPFIARDDTFAQEAPAADSAAPAAAGDGETKISEDKPE